MHVIVRVRDVPIKIDVGTGNQRLKWLAMVALQRYFAATVTTDPALGIGMMISHAEVAIGIMDAEGNELSPNKSVRVALTDGQEVFALLQSDEVEQTTIPSAKGTSKWLMMQGAAPSKVIMTGPCITYALEGQSNFFMLQARDTYGNMSGNGGAKFDVRVSRPDSLTKKQLGETQPDAPPEVIDHGDGSYLVRLLHTRKGRYEINVALDGEPIAGSPFATVAVKTFVPPMIKWLVPRVNGGAEPEPFSHAAVVTYGRSLVLFGGLAGSTSKTHALNGVHSIHIEKMRWEQPKVIGKPPSPRGACSSCLAGHRLLIYGGEVDKGVLTDEFWALDLERASWIPMNIKGVAPGPVAFGAAACVGNKAYFFGGSDGKLPTNRFHAFNIVTQIWEPLDDNPGGPRPSPRFGHSLVTVEANVVMYGGRDTLMGYNTLAIYDTATNIWSTPATRGDICRERAFHSSFLWGRNVVVALGNEKENESNQMNLLNMDTLYWESWDGNIARRGGAFGLLDGKLLACGGEESKEKKNNLSLFNMGGYMMSFDGVDDEIMIPMLPTICADKYTIEAWVRPAKVGPMNIFCRSDEGYPGKAWSHQLRINNEGKFEHYVEADEKFCVSHTLSVEAGKWYHVAGSASGDGELKLFVDGQEEGTPQDIGGLRQKLDRWFIGSATGDGMGYFEGNIGEVRLFNYARTEDEIAAENRKILNGTERGIVGYWRINEGPGAMVFDFSSYNNPGPIKGEPNWTANLVPTA